MKQVYNTSNAAQVMRSAQIQAALAEARQEMEEISTIKRVDVLNMYLEAVNMARTMSEPATIVRAADSIAKLLGYNAPEVKEHRVTVGQAENLARLDSMSDEELLKLMDANTVDGEFTHVNH